MPCLLLLIVLAFLVIGLELGPVIGAAQPGELTHWMLLGAAVLATVIAVRLLFTLQQRGSIGELRSEQQLHADRAENEVHHHRYVLSGSAHALHGNTYHK